MRVLSSISTTFWLHRRRKAISKNRQCIVPPTESYLTDLSCWALMHVHSSYARVAYALSVAFCMMLPGCRSARHMQENLTINTPGGIQPSSSKRKSTPTPSFTSCGQDLVCNQTVVVSIFCVLWHPPKQAELNDCL